MAPVEPIYLIEASTHSIPRSPDRLSTAVNLSDLYKPRIADIGQNCVRSNDQRNIVKRGWRGKKFPYLSQVLFNNGV